MTLTSTAIKDFVSEGHRGLDMMLNAGGENCHGR